MTPDPAEGTMTPEPCPFCGGPAWSAVATDGEIYAHCNWHRCAGYHIVRSVTLEEWNRRAPLPASPVPDYALIGRAVAESFYLDGHIDTEWLRALLHWQDLRGYPVSVGSAAPETATGTADGYTGAVMGEWNERAKHAIFLARAYARSHGYALAVHGTLRRDIDVALVPWTDEATDARTVVDAIYDGLMKSGVAIGWCNDGENGMAKPHGRLAYSIMLSGSPFMYLDISVAPRSLAAPSGGSGAVSKKSLDVLMREFGDDTPDHECGFIVAPDTGHCAFHEAWADVRAAALSPGGEG
jgi:hypothetical protein